MEVAAHNPIMARPLPELRSALAGLMPQAPTIPVISTVYESAGTTPVFDADYWVANLRNPVRFNQAVTTAGGDHGTFIEDSAHPMLTHAVTEILESVRPTGRVLVTSAMNRGEDQTLFFHSQLA